MHLGVGVAHRVTTFRSICLRREREPEGGGSPLHTFGQPGSVTDVSNEAHSFVGKANLRIGVGHYKLGLPLFCRWVLKRMSSGGLRVCLSALQ